MKKIILIASIFFASCETSTVKIVNENTEIPASAYNKAADTTTKFEQAFMDDNHIYLVKDHKIQAVAKTKSAEDGFVIAFIVFFVLFWVGLGVALTK